MREEHECGGAQLAASADKYSRAQLEPIIDDWIIGELHAERNRYIIKRRLFGGIPYNDLAAEVKERYGFELSVKQLGRIVSKGIKTIKKHLD